MSQSRRVRTVGVAMATMSFALSTLSVSSAGAVSQRLAMVAPAVHAPAGAHALGASNLARTMNFSIYLRSSNGAGLARYAAGVTNTHSATYGHYLAPGEFARRFGASASSLATVRAALRADGLHIGQLTDGLALHARATVATINAAFHTTVESYRLAGGSLGTGLSRPVMLPSALARLVLGVIGLNNLVHSTSSTKGHLPQKRLSHIRWPNKALPGRSFGTHNDVANGPAACSSAVSATSQGFGGITDDQVANAYGVSSLYSAGDLGAGQTVAVYELEPFALSDVATFDQCYFGADHSSNVSTVNVDGGPGIGLGSGESALDIQNVSALAPSAHIVVYQAPNTTSGALDAYARIVSDDTAKIVTTSWGLCEAAAAAYSPGSLDVEHLLFEQAAAQGQSVFAAAGDNGADDCAGHGSYPVAPVLSVDDPASQPYVVSVGGTTAITVANPPSEQVWNDGATGGAGGGGVSSLWPMTPWQHNVTSVVTAAGAQTCGTASSCRVTPDVSAFADEFTGITIAYGGGWYTIGGTSSAAPLWAAMLAEVNASSSCTSNVATANGVGFVSPLLYEVGANASAAASAYNDVTAGNNDVFSINGGAYAAGTGFDAASGFGSPNLSGNGGPGLAAALCGAANSATTSALSSVLPTVGNASGGTLVTVKGAGFMTGSTVNVTGVAFGEVPATSFNVVNATTLTARTAPAQSAHLTPFAHSSVADSLVAVTFASGHVAVGGKFSYQSIGANRKKPVVLSVGPSGGPTVGGNLVTIYGTGFAGYNTGYTGASSVSFGGVASPSFTIKSDSMIVAVAPASTSASCLAISHTAASGLCQTSVVVTSVFGSSAVVTPLRPLQGYLTYNNLGIPTPSPNCKCEIFPTLTEYDYQAAPTISKLTVLNFGGGSTLSPYGGDQVFYQGTGFNYLTLNDALQGAGDSQVQVANVIDVTYTGFYMFTSGDPNPSPTGDSQPFSVNTLGGTSASKSLAFAAVPKITSISTHLLPSAGGTSLVITGEGFTHIQSVVFSSPFGLPSTAVLKNFTVDSSTQITVTSPSLTPATYVLFVGNANGDSGLYNIPLRGAPLSFQTVPYSAANVVVTYPGGAAITDSSGTTCSSDGGCYMILYGVNLGSVNALNVYVGAQQASVVDSLVLGSDYSLLVLIPPSFQHQAGLVTVLVTTDHGNAPLTLSAIVHYT
jgi:hypothetical protein